MFERTFSKETLSARDLIKGIQLAWHYKSKILVFDIVKWNFLKESPAKNWNGTKGSKEAYLFSKDFERYKIAKESKSSSNGKGDTFEPKLESNDNACVGFVILVTSEVFRIFKLFLVWVQFILIEVDASFIIRVRCVCSFGRRPSFRFQVMNNFFAAIFLIYLFQHWCSNCTWTRIFMIKQALLQFD